MTEKTIELHLQDHRKLGINYFNKIWEFIEKKDRSAEDDEMMLHYAHSSTLHWLLSECPKVNKQRGYWILSRVYSILNRPKSALIYATLCLENTERPSEENGFNQFDVAYANEAMARAYAINSNQAGFEKYYALAKKEGEKIAEKGDKDYWNSDLASGPWNNML